MLNTLNNSPAKFLPPQPAILAANLNFAHQTGGIPL